MENIEELRRQLMKFSLFTKHELILTVAIFEKSPFHHSPLEF